MSCDQAITDAEQQQLLLPFRPRTGACKRRAFLSSKAMSDITSPNQSPTLLGGAGYIDAALTKWVRGERIYKGFIKRLRVPPPEIWEIRVTNPSPQWRVFFRFAGSDTMIVHGVYSRTTLGKEGSQAWQTAMAECETFWNQTLPGQTPFVNGEWSTNYVTENCDAFKV